MSSVRRCGLLLAACSILLACWAPSAGAHAVLVDSRPGDEAIVAGTVDEVRLSFNESISVAFGGGKVWGPDGGRVDSGSARVDGGDELVIPVDAATPGTYAVSYRIVSGDGHPVRGASTFHVDVESPGSVSEDKANAASAANRPIEIAFGVSRGFALAALLVLAGGVVFASCIAPGVARVWFARTALATAMIGVAASFVLDAANAAGFSLLEVARWEVLRAEASTTWGRSAVAQLLALVGLAIWLRAHRFEAGRSRGRGVLGVVLAVVPLLAWSAGGHAVAARPVWLRLPLDMAHMVAAGVWVGGLVALLAALRAQAVEPAMLRRWSRVAMGAVGVLVVTGLYASFAEIGLSRAALLETTYGRLVLAKALLLMGALPLAWLNQRHHVPVAGTDAWGVMQPRMRRFVAGEIAVLALVVAATAALIQTPPARSTVAPPLVDRVVALRGGGDVQVILDPARAGRNEIHVYVTTASGRGDESVTDVTLAANGGGKGIEGLDIPLLPAGPGHFTTPAKTIPFAGRWTFEVQVERGAFDSRGARFTASIGRAER